MELPKLHPNCARFRKDEAKQIRNPKGKRSGLARVVVGFKEPKFLSGGVSPRRAVQNLPEGPPYSRGLQVSRGWKMLNTVAMKTTQAVRFRYSYDEFAEHILAMKTVRQWEETVRFGHVGIAQTTWANGARIVEYFSDSYEDSREALYKAGVFLSIYDYIGRHEELLSRKSFLEKIEERHFSVDSALLRAVHYIFTSMPQPASIEPRKILALAKVFRELEPQG
jgi:hypothetical protein